MTDEIPKNGLFTDFYANSQMKSRGKYKDGKKDGKWAIASIPAFFILMLLFAIFGGFFVGIYSFFF